MVLPGAFTICSSAGRSNDQGPVGRWGRSSPPARRHSTQYLARWRLSVAARLLENSEMSFAQAGAQVGYQSEAAFQRAFKKYVGTPPGAGGGRDRDGRRRPPGTT